METLLACVYPEAASDDDDSEDEGVCVGCVCEGVAILDEGIEEAARRPDAAEPKELTAWSRARLNKLKRHRAEARKQRSILLRFREKTRKPSKPHTARYEDAVAAGWRALALDGTDLMPLLSTISRAELDDEATLAATRLGKPFEKPGPSIREGLDYIDFRGDGVLHVRIADWYRARAKRDHARMKQMELEVGALLVAGAPTEVKSDEGLTPLLQACKYDAGTIVRVLIAAEAEYQQVQNAQKLRPLLLAAQENSPNAFEVIADALREKGVLASAARRPGNGYTVLHFAAIADAADLIKRAGRFDEFRKSVDVLSSEGETKTGALHKCAMYAHLESMRALLELGADVDLRDSNGATALHVAALAARFEKDRRHKACVDLLLRHGASIDVADGRGRLLRDLPTSNNVKRVLKRSTTLPVSEKENAMLCHNADARVAARRSFAFGRTFFVDTCDAGYKELTYINFLEALCRFIHVEVEVPLFGHLREIGVNELCEFYEILHFRATNGADAIHAINELRRMLMPDTELTLAEKLALVLPHMLACFSVTCGGDFETKLDHVRLNTLLSEEQKQKWIKKKCHISRGDCEHVLALDEFKAVTHAVDKKHVFAEAVQLKKSAEKGVSDGAGVW